MGSAFIWRNVLAECYSTKELRLWVSCLLPPSTPKADRAPNKIHFTITMFCPNKIHLTIRMFWQADPLNQLNIRFSATSCMRFCPIPEPSNLRIDALLLSGKLSGT